MREDASIAAKMRGKRLPLIDRVEVYIIEEPQPRWLAFLNREHDLIERVPAEYVTSRYPRGSSRPTCRSRRSSSIAPTSST